VRFSSTRLPGQGAFFEEFEELARSLHPPSPDDPEIAQIFERHGWEIIGPSPL
jgi:hypothetical protein